MKITRKIAVILCIFASSCTSTVDFDKGKAILEDQGYTDVQSTGYDSFCCSDKDTYSTGFTAKNKKGILIRGCICSGIGKGITIRYQ